MMCENCFSMLTRPLILLYNDISGFSNTEMILFFNKGVFEHMGLLGHQGASECMVAFKHMWVSRWPQIYGGVNSVPPSVELTCH